MSGPESVLPPGASSGMSDILLRTSCCKISLPLKNAPGGNADSGPAHTYFRHRSQTCSGADVLFRRSAKPSPLYKEAGANVPASVNFLLD